MTKVVEKPVVVETAKAPTLPEKSQYNYTDAVSERIDFQVKHAMEKRKLENALAESPDIKVLIAEYKADLSLTDLQGGEVAVRAKVDLIKAKRKYEADMNSINAGNLEKVDAARRRARLFSQPRISNVEVFHLASAGYFLAYDNGRAFIKSENGKWSALVKPNAGDDGIGNANVVMGNSMTGEINELSPTEFADLVKNKPPYESAVKAYRLFFNDALSFQSDKSTKVW